jgi:hypothetical protein
MLASMQGKRNPHTLFVGKTITTIPMGTSMDAAPQLKVELPHDPVILCLGIYLKECMSGYSKDTCTPLYCSIIHENLAVEPYTDE